ncbi:cysteine hydrolase [Alcaligenes nematophilus]|uniref:cysteine hydrolase family protein n=1 Tax=Alcaligenes TaxID=507 RepID=UPI000E8B4F79|nr:MULTISPECIES: isochorismatase family cysteine hydrolase [Alcaligenes]QRF91945.1 isochorismatase [Alcaligenes faecalis]HBJ67465.1 cysteine hydrolase [Alcaligenes faecalis]
MAIQIDQINPSSTAVIVIDMQNDFIAPGAPLETPMGMELMPRLKKLLGHARQTGMEVIFTAHAHRRNGCDMGLFGEIYPPIQNQVGLVDKTAGVDIYPEVAPQGDEVVIKKHRYSAFFGTDLDIILRTRKIDTVVITGVTTENCCHATARDAMFHGYKVAFISDATGTYNYPDMGFGAIPAEEVHRVTLGVLAVSTAHVMTTDELIHKSRQ